MTESFEDQDDVVKPDLAGRYRLDIGVGENGAYVIDQTEVETEETRRVAVFPPESRVVRVLDKKTGKHRFATRDMAEIRAMVFARIFSELASYGKLEI